MIKTKKDLKKNGVINNIDNPPNDYLYEVALNTISGLTDDCIVCEIGTRNADSAMYIFQAIKDSGKKNWFWTIDPYGLKPYRVEDKTHIMEMDYGEQHYREAMSKLSSFSLKNELNHYHWRLLSDDFINNIDNVEYWYNKKKIDIKFGFSFLDGEHYNDIVLREFDWFYNRTVNGGVIAVDDVHFLGGFDKFNENIKRYNGELVFFQDEGNHRAYFKKI